MRMGHRVMTAAAMVLAAATATGTALATPCIHDDTFLRTVHQGNMAEIAAGKDAQRYAVSRCVRDVGKVLVRDHRELDDGVADLAHKLDVSLPRSVTSEQRDQLRDIRRKGHSRRYDRMWLKAQEAGHVAVLKLIDEEVKSGKDATVRAGAGAARPVVAKHLDMVRGCMQRRR